MRQTPMQRRSTIDTCRTGNTPQKPLQSEAQQTLVKQGPRFIHLLDVVRFMQSKAQQTLVEQGTRFTHQCRANRNRHLSNREHASNTNVERRAIDTCRTGNTPQTPMQSEGQQTLVEQGIRLRHQCRAKGNRHLSNREHASDTNVERRAIDTCRTGNTPQTPMEIKANNKCFCLFMCKFQNFVITQHYCINAIYVNCWKIYNLLVQNVFASKHNEKLARDFLFVLFLKLVQINFIFTDIVCMFSIYCLLFGKYTNNIYLT